MVLVSPDSTFVPTEIQLFHIGEVILADLLRELAAREEKVTIPCRAHRDCSLETVFEAAGLHAARRFAPNVPLIPVLREETELAFDGAHCVDVLAHQDDGTAVAFEAKLGLGRLSRSEFEKRFLAKLERSHSGRRVKGSMIALLSHRYIEGVGHLPLRTALSADKELARAWVLVVRRATWLNWSRVGNSPPALGADAHIVCFDDVAAAFGTAEDFDALVHRAVGDGFSTAWGLGLALRSTSKFI